MSNLKNALDQRAKDAVKQDDKFEKYKNKCLSKAFSKAARDEDGLVEAIYNDEPYRVYFEDHAFLKYGPTNFMRAFNTHIRGIEQRKFFPYDGDGNLIMDHPEYKTFVEKLDQEGFMVEDARVGYDESIRFFAVVAEIPAMYEYADIKIAIKP